MTAREHAIEIYRQVERLRIEHGDGDAFRTEAMLYLEGIVMRWRRLLVERPPVALMLLDWIDENSGRCATQGHIAQEIGTRRETVARNMKVLMERGLVCRERIDKQYAYYRTVGGQMGCG